MHDTWHARERACGTLRGGLWHVTGGLWHVPGRLVARFGARGLWYVTGGGERVVARYRVGCPGGHGPHAVAINMGGPGAPHGEQPVFYSQNAEAMSAAKLLGGGRRAIHCLLDWLI